VGRALFSRPLSSNSTLPDISQDRGQKAVNMDTLDAVIVREYATFNTPVDRILVDPALSGQFVDLVNSTLAPVDRVDESTLKSRLLTLRKRGQNKKGLPRLRRAFNGRSPRGGNAV
jgi:hypothetical protein